MMKTFKVAGIFMVSIMMGVLFFTSTASAQSEVTWYNGGVPQPTWPSLPTAPFSGTAYAYPGGATATYWPNPDDIFSGVQYTVPVATIRIKEICDENGQHCKTVSTGLGGGASNALTTPDGSQANVVYVNSSANVGVGTTNPQSKLAVNGTITAKEVKVTQAGWSDYVFAEDYRLLPLDELEAYVGTEKHLPGIPAAKEVEEKGLAIADTLSKQMQKIEELTLYLIQLKKENEDLKKRISTLEERR
jgi:hypothetical protein